MEKKTQSIRGRLITIRFHEFQGAKRACVQFGKSRSFFTLPEEYTALINQIAILVRYDASIKEKGLG